MKHKVKVTVIDKKSYPELQQQFCADPNAGACPCYNIGDEFIFERDEKEDSFWKMGINTLIKTNADSNMVAGGSGMPHCSEAWDAISRQGDSVERGRHLHRSVGRVCLMNVPVTAAVHLHYNQEYTARCRLWSNSRMRSNSRLWSNPRRSSGGTVTDEDRRDGWEVSCLFSLWGEWPSDGHTESKGREQDYA